MLVDLRSDTVTRPTPEMMAAIAQAEVGDAARGDDPTVQRLERRAAELVGKDAAIFVPSGTMGNLAAVTSHVQPGDEVILEADCHIYNSEVGGLAMVAGALPRPLPGRDGVLDPDDVRAAIKTGAKANAPRTGLLCLETTHNAAGGTALPLETMAALAAVAAEAGIPVHLDGARMFNAAHRLGCEVADICRHVDTVMFCVSKGLGAPMGSLLVGSREFIARAQKKVRMLGGGMRQVGLMAAAGLVSLDEPAPRLERDHQTARALAEGLAELHPSLVRLETVQTNLVNCHLGVFGNGASSFAAALKERGVLVNQSARVARFVTHRHIGDEEVAFALAAVRAVAGELGMRA